MADEIIRTAKNIAELFGQSESWVRGRVPEFKKAGVIFYLRTGRPPRKIMCAWKSVLQAYTIEKQSRGEKI